MNIQISSASQHVIVYFKEYVKEISYKTTHIILFLHTLKHTCMYKKR